MSSLEERLEAAMCEDSTIAIPAQHELVRELMERRLVGSQREVLTGADGSRSPLRLLAPDEALCGRCRQELSGDDNFCFLCGYTTPRGAA